MTPLIAVTIFKKMICILIYVTFEISARHNLKPRFKHILPVYAVANMFTAGIESTNLIVFGSFCLLMTMFILIVSTADTWKNRLAFWFYLKFFP